MTLTFSAFKIPLLHAPLTTGRDVASTAEFAGGIEPRGLLGETEGKRAAMHEGIVGWRSVLPRLGVVDPLRLSCRGVDGRDLGERGTDIENAVNHERSRFPHPSFQMIRFRDLFLSGAPCPHGPQAIEIVPANLRERRIFRTGLVASIVQPFRRRALNLLRLRMRGTADTQHRIRALSRLHDGSHSSQERCCDQGCPGYQSVTPARHRMYLLLIGIVTSIAHERSPYNYELCWLDIPTVPETSNYRNARLLSGSSARTKPLLRRTLRVR